MRLLHARGRSFLLAAAIGGLVGLAAGTALAAPPLNISFHTYGTASVGWSPQHSAIQCDLLSDNGSAVVLTVHHASLSADEPMFTYTAVGEPSGNTAGPPRWVISVSDSTGSGILWQPGGPGTDWSVLGLSDVTASGGYSTVYSALSDAHASVDGVFIVDDWNAGSASSQVTTFTSIDYDGTELFR